MATGQSEVAIRWPHRENHAGRPESGRPCCSEALTVTGQRLEHGGGIIGGQTTLDQGDAALAGYGLGLVQLRQIPWCPIAEAKLGGGMGKVQAMGQAEEVVELG